MKHRSTGLTFLAPEKSQVGFVLFAPFASDQVYLSDKAGKVVHRWQGAPGLTHAAYLLENGNLWVNELSDAPRGVSLTTSGRLRERDKTGQVVWEHHDPWQHHDGRRLSEGGAIYIAYLPPNAHRAKNFTGGVAGSETADGMFGECLREVDANGQVVWEWSTDQLPAKLRRLHRNANRWSAGHLNTVQPLNDGTVLVCSKTLNMTFLLRRGTGELLWYFQNDLLGGPHDAQILDTGNVLIFANGAFASDLHHSQVWEIDRSTKEIVWRYYQRNNPMLFFSPHIGGCQRLEGGNTLICEGAQGGVFEVTPEGEIVWEFINPECGYHANFGNANWLFRTRNYTAKSSAIRMLGLG